MFKDNWLLFKINENGTITRFWFWISDTSNEINVPKCVHCDNEPQLSSNRMREFAKLWSFDYITCCPLYLQTSEMIEMVKKC